MGFEDNTDATDISFIDMAHGLQNVGGRFLSDTSSGILDFIMVLFLRRSLMHLAGPLLFWCP